MSKIYWEGINIADAGFVINLEHRTDRLQTAITALHDVNITGVQRIDGILFTPEEHFYKPQGCTQAHINIAKLQIKNNWEYVLYLEDDIEPYIFYPQDHNIDPPPRIDIKSVINTMVYDISIYKPDVLFLGTDPRGNTLTQVTDVLLQPTQVVKTHAYLGSLKFAKFLVNNLQYRDPCWFASHAGGWPIDFFISQLISKDDWVLTYDGYSGGERVINNDLKVYVLVPSIFTQGRSFSDLQLKDCHIVDPTRGGWIDSITTSAIDIKGKYLTN